MPEQPRRPPTKRWLSIGSAVVLVMVAFVIVAKVVAVVRCARHRAASSQVAAAALAGRPDVAAIVSARRAVRAHAEQAGLESPRVVAWIEHRPGSSSPSLVIELAGGHCHVLHEHSLTDRLPEQALHQLAHEGIRVRAGRR